MATNSLAAVTTISDVINTYSSLDGNAAYVKAVNILARKIPLFRYLPVKASNQVMSEITSKVSSLGTPSLRRFNEYISPTKNQRTPGTEPIALFEDWSEVDDALYQIQNDPIQWRMDEDAAKMESMGQAIEDQLFNGNISEYPAGINGLFIRYNSSTTYPNGDSSTGARYNVQLAGGSGSDVTSVVVLELGPTKVHGIFPKNTRAGIFLENMGRQTIYNSTGQRMLVQQTHLQAFFGLVVRDDRCVQMVRNIEVSGSTSLLDMNMLSSALRRLPGGGQDPNTIILCSPTVMDQFDQQANEKLNVIYTPDNVWGGMITRFKGVPVYIAEKGIKETQTAIS